MAYNPRDKWFLKAKEENFAARSVYKLEDIDRRYKILKPGMKVLDLGAAPGSWSQYASRVLGEKGRIVGIDLNTVEVDLPNAVFLVADVRAVDMGALMLKAGVSPPFDVVMSDMAPLTTGIKLQDQERSFELCMFALAAADRFLKSGGTFIAKLFNSQETDVFRAELRTRFKRVEMVKPPATRSESRERFFVGLGFMGGAKAAKTARTATVDVAEESPPPG
ncbi:MAG: RlmE family RNA methyltransferase [Dehalococcoidia bacterium]|nr:RlmE family RNA methyltransferase [Dehalococcoidia bacterium]